ncbi:hydroxysteroid dehydrogenase-like protein 2 [Saccostrea echinata]|uniref:hydroxysteroid dehydrogenase-like protein 2 n=1 Tax=Saccostrea echinata TaxID=191078 RepID=UPI002A80B260|nr:hydroxysteroid dehydrogenase-like protein 2 [Saccostrea echinata]XP_061197545.1 hydroxysteroid dehydrogenase-like protein 2 [Saccostrea echinata]
MKSALVIGASRGIGKQVAIILSRNGYSVGVAAKTEVSQETLPGSIHDVVRDITKEGGVAIPIKCNARKSNDIQDAVTTCIEKFGKLDLAVYNAGAILWKPVIETPLSRFDLLHEVNVRGAYTMVQQVLPHFLERNTGRIILVSPPVYKRFFKGKTPYSISKIGMTVLTHGLANELKDTGVSISSLWPATAIKAFVTDKLQTPSSVMRTPDVFADAVLKIAEENSEKLNGLALIDEDFLRTTGVSDFSKYRCDPDVEPPRMMPRKFPDLSVEEENDKVFPKL